MNAHSRSTLECQLKEEAETIAVGAALASAFVELRVRAPSKPLCLHLLGELGAGKSTLARALLRALGVTGKIKSPTYALVEPYDSAHGLLLHMDLYRLTEAAELEYLGIDSLFAQAALMLIEWPQKAGALLPEPDLKICLSHNSDASDEGRRLEVSAISVSGNLLMPKLAAFF